MAYVTTLNDGFDNTTFALYMAQGALSGDYTNALNYVSQYNLSQDEQNGISFALSQVGINWVPPPPKPQVTPPTPTNPVVTPPVVVKQTPVVTPPVIPPASNLNIPPLPPTQNVTIAPATTSGVMSKIKDHKGLVSIAAGTLIWFLTKKPIAGAAVGAGTYLVTDKVIK